MEADALITLQLENQSGVNSQDPRKRAQSLRNLQTIFALVANDRNWQFRYGSDEITVLANQHEVLLPVDWLSWGPGGGLFRAGTTNRLKWVPQWKFVRLLEGLQQTGPPYVYTELNSTDAGLRTLGVYPTPTVNTDLSAHYFRAVPVLNDDNDGLLNFVPPVWHQSVLYEGLVRLDMKDVANIQSKEQKQIFNELMMVMRAEERGGRQANHNLVPYSAGMNRRRW